MKSINDFVKNTGLSLAGLGLAGMLNLSGCSPIMRNMSDAEVLSAFGAALIVGADTKEGAIVGAVAKTIGDNQVVKEAAREGKDITNIYINSQGLEQAQNDSRLIPEYNIKQLEQEVNIGTVAKEVMILGMGEGHFPQFGLYSLFTFSRYLDLNGDGKWNLNEFDPKRNFKKGEPVNIAIVYNETAGEKYHAIWTKDFWTGHGTEVIPTNVKLDIKVLNSKGQIIYDKSNEQVLTQVIELPQNELGNLNISKKVAKINLGDNLAPGIYNVSCDFLSDYNYSDWSHKNMKTQTGGVFQVLDDTETQK